MAKENVFDTLMERGYIEQVTHEELKDVLGKESVPFYIGFDPTADSLYWSLYFFNGCISNAKSRSQTYYSTWWWYCHYW